MSDEQFHPPQSHVTLVLCGHANTAEGKLYINGEGWTLTGPNPTPSGVALLIRVP